MNLEDLIGSLRAHDVVLQGDKPVKKVKTLALKASQQTSSVAEDDVQEPQEIEEVHEEEAEDELALILQDSHFDMSEKQRELNRKQKTFFLNLLRYKRKIYF